MAGKRQGANITAGVDVGGTWIRIVTEAPGRRPRRTRFSTTRVPNLSTFLPSALYRLCDGQRPAALVVASRGIWTVRERRALARRLRDAAHRVEVLSDAQAALLGALAGRAGVLVLAGTGSIAIGRDAHGRWTRAGGFGPLLGDEGSAFWIGREWLRATTGGEDFGPVRRLVRAPDAVRRIAALAPGVLRRAARGDRRARTIVRGAEDHLAALVVSVANELRLRSPVEVSWAGSMMSNPAVRGGVARALARAGVRARWIAPETSAVVAAARRAAELARVTGGRGQPRVAARRRRGTR